MSTSEGRIRNLFHQFEEGRHVTGGEIVADAAAGDDQDIACERDACCAENRVLSGACGFTPHDPFLSRSVILERTKDKQAEYGVQDSSENMKRQPQASKKSPVKINEA